MARRFYDSTAWRKLRQLKLTDDPLCEWCQRTGRAVPATDVDHIVPISKGGAPLDPVNLQALCHGCHSRKTARDKADSDAPLKGATRDGLPLDPMHPWNRGAS